MFSQGYYSEADDVDKDLTAKGKKCVQVTIL
jgi:hypothetical protein